MLFVLVLVFSVLVDDPGSSRVSKRKLRITSSSQSMIYGSVNFYLLYLICMTIQTNPEVFNPLLPVHTVTHIDKPAGVVTLTGSDGASHKVRLDSWGPSEWSQPVIGSKVQLLP